ncbi:VirB4 family type IV secretion/conjugal transfer ATPase [Hyphomonas sp.]|uniref:VirB4 family type IV secretion/conjugal transfer ATPase n=1 Tax=Hyphomonas sp. TaxID=87 RepID=UPI0033415E7E
MSRKRQPPRTSTGQSRAARREQGGASMLPFAKHVDNITLAAREGDLLQVIHLQGFSFETADTEELNYRKTVRDTMLRSLATSRLALYHHIIRRRVDPELEGTFTNQFTGAIDRAWKGRISSKKLLANDLFLTLVRRPSQGQMGWLDGLLQAGSSANAASSLARERRDLDATREGLLAALAPYGPRVLSVYDGPQGKCSELLELFACIYNGSYRPVGLATRDVSAAIPCRRVSFGSDALELAPTGDQRASFGAIISLKEYPPHTSPGQFDNLMRLPHEFVLTESFAFADRQNALDRMNLALRRMRAADDDARTLQADLVLAKDDLSAGRAAFGEHHITVLVRSDQLDSLHEAAGEVQAALSEVGAIAVREQSALEPSFWAQFPGAFKFIPRRSLISSANFAGMASFHNHPLGQAQANHWGPAVTVLETTASSPYFFNFHRGDLGNFLIIGPSGTGKTVLLNFLLAQAQKFNPRIVFFDKDRGAEIFLRAMNARYEVLRPGQPTGFNPLQLPDTSANRRFLQMWCARLLTSHGEVLTSDDMAVISDAVSANFDQAPGLRRLRFFRELFTGLRRPSTGDLAARLSPWVGTGDRAWLFDNDADLIDLSARSIGFDMSQVLDDALLRTPVMMYLFHCVEQRLDGDPTIIVVDEGWKALDDEVFVARIRDWEKTIRKRNGIVGFATQNAGDALESRIASAIIEQSATQIFLPNPKARAEDYCQGFGLTVHELDLIRTLPDTSRCFLIKHGRDSVVARLNLSGLPELLTVLSGSERSVRLLDGLRAQFGDDPASWLPRLLAEAR